MALDAATDEGLAYLEAFYRHPLVPVAREAYLAEMRKLPQHELPRAVVRLTETLRWFPSMQEIVEAVHEQRRQRWEVTKARTPGVTAVRGAKHPLAKEYFAVIALGLAGEKAQFIAGCRAMGQRPGADMEAWEAVAVDAERRIPKRAS